MPGYCAPPGLTTYVVVPEEWRPWLLLRCDPDWEWCDREEWRVGEEECARCRRWCCVGACETESFGETMDIVWERSGERTWGADAWGPWERERVGVPRPDEWLGEGVWRRGELDDEPEWRGW